MSGEPAAPWAPTFVLVTCEHAGRDVPAEYRRLFRGAGRVLASHRGHDIGALGVAMRLSADLACPLLFTTITRLLVEANRSLDSPELFSEYTARLSGAEQEKIIARYYAPYRRTVESVVAGAIGRDHRVLHVSVHSFTDVWEGEPRPVDIGLLFDPARAEETAECAAWRERIVERAPDLRVRFNEPYRGDSDGVTTWLRGRMSGDRYAGIEVEVRQGLLSAHAHRRRMGGLLAATLMPLLSSRSGKA